MNERGKLEAVGKTLGRRKSLTALAERLFENIESETEPIFISHADCIEDAEFVKKTIEARLPKAKITLGEIGAVIGSHAGSRTLAVFYKGKSR
jgi:fatty acid-binding protein DegV